MRNSASQNLFSPIFKVIYHNIQYWGEFAAFLGNFVYVWGILGEFQAEIFRRFFD
jgi:hypothetical protein